MAATIEAFNIISATDAYMGAGAKKRLELVFEGTENTEGFEYFTL